MYNNEKINIMTRLHFEKLEGTTETILLSWIIEMGSMMIGFRKHQLYVIGILGSERMV